MFRSPESYIRRKGYELEGDISDGRFSRVYTARRGGDLLVVKYPTPNETDSSDYMGDELPTPFSSKVAHIKREREVLQRIGGMDGIVQPVDYFEVWFSLVKLLGIGVDKLLGGQYECFREFKFPVIVNDYIEGHTLAHGEYVRGEDNERVLIEAVHGIHNEMMAGLDLRRPNIVIADSGKPPLVDLGWVSVFDQWSEDYYLKRDKDLRVLEELLESQVNIES
jgi:serine/threonine protein kinase